jgi:hypothetical protein
MALIRVDLQCAEVIVAVLCMRVGRAELTTFFLAALVSSVVLVVIEMCIVVACASQGDIMGPEEQSH